MTALLVVLVVVVAAAVGWMVYTASLPPPAVPFEDRPQVGRDPRTGAAVFIRRRR